MMRGCENKERRETERGRWNQRRGGSGGGDEEGVGEGEGEGSHICVCEAREFTLETTLLGQGRNRWNILLSSSSTEWSV